jgi:hypothetical protein
MGVVDDEFVAAMPVTKLFQKTLKLGDDCPRTRRWIDRVIAYDRPVPAA